MDNILLGHAKNIGKSLEFQVEYLRTQAIEKKQQLDKIEVELREIEFLLDETETQYKFWGKIIHDYSNEKGGVCNGNGTGA